MHRTRNPTPRLPTPPPEYGDIVKTEEDWNRVMERLGIPDVIVYVLVLFSKLEFYIKLSKIVPSEICIF